MSEVFKKECYNPVCDYEPKYIIIGRKVDQNFHDFDKYYCELHYEEIKNRL